MENARLNKDIGEEIISELQKLDLAIDKLLKEVQDGRKEQPDTSPS